MFFLHARGVPQKAAAVHTIGTGGREMSSRSSKKREVTSDVLSESTSEDQESASEDQESASEDQESTSEDRESTSEDQESASKDQEDAAVTEGALVTGAAVGSDKDIKVSSSNTTTIAFVLSVAIIIALVVLIILLVAIIARIVFLQSPPRIPETVNALYDEVGQNISKAIVECSVFVNQTLTSSFLNDSSCAAILRRNPSARSGYYTLKSSKGLITNAYCDMTRTCGNITGGWMRIAKLDPVECPYGLQYRLFSKSGTCVLSLDGPGCVSVFYKTFDIPYSRVCGTARGYAIGTLDGLCARARGIHLDGIHLVSKGIHIWALVGGRCKCRPAISSIRDYYTCDNTRCAPDEICKSLLWSKTDRGRPVPFYRKFPEATTKDIEMRVCRDEHRDNEDIAITTLELFVQE